MTIGQRIKTRRKELGLTQKKLGELCGMADSAIRKYESDLITPKYNTLKKIAHALKLPVYALSGIDFVDVEEDFSVAEIFIDKIDSDAAEILGINIRSETGVFSMPLYNKEDKEALSFLLQNQSVAPSDIMRLLVAFSKLNFIGQRMLLSNAEYMAQHAEVSRNPDPSTIEQQSEE